MTVFCTFSFHTDIQKLQKNNSYCKILDDICNFFLIKTLPNYI